MHRRMECIGQHKDFLLKHKCSICLCGPLTVLTYPCAPMQLLSLEDTWADHEGLGITNKDQATCLLWCILLVMYPYMVLSNKSQRIKYGRFGYKNLWNPISCNSVHNLMAGSIMDTAITVVSILGAELPKGTDWLLEHATDVDNQSICMPMLEVRACCLMLSDAVV